MHVGAYHEYCGVFSTMGGYHPLKFEYHGGHDDTCGGYHEYCVVFSTVGYSNNKRFSPQQY